MKAKTIMLQGTSSDVGKSIITAALGRIFLQDGYRTAPFKGQNMALNSYVTEDGGEMGRAQVVQAAACKIKPDVRMNPVLLKPVQNSCSQVVVLGTPVGNYSASEYHTGFKDKAWAVVQESLKILGEDFDVLVIEGAGSPAEVNLKKNDIVNMAVAKETGSPVLLIADIDRGGAIASVVGTLALLDDEERDLVKGILINKFRGDINLLKPAFDIILEKTGKPVVGVIPYLDNINIPEEDSVAVEKKKKKNMTTEKTGEEMLDIALIRLPHISNFTDFDSLETEPDVNLRYVFGKGELGSPDLIIIPGSKNTLGDMNFLQETGLAAEIIRQNDSGVPVAGICGGYQILGRKMYDPHKTESDHLEFPGLGLLDVETTFLTEKTTVQNTGRITGPSEGLLQDCTDMEITGYEIHMGESVLGGKSASVIETAEKTSDGAVSPDGWVLGTYFHGIFDNDAFRRTFLNNIRGKKGLLPLDEIVSVDEIQENAYNRLADIVRENLDMDYICEVMGL